MSIYRTMHNEQLKWVCWECCGLKEKDKMKKN